jgi:ribose transport system substrate-binding protein
MAKPRFLVSLTTSDNDYQLAQAQAAEESARKLGVEAQIVFADNDAINQSTQVLKAIQSPPTTRPNAIVFEPVGGTALPQVAQAANTAGIAWAVLNRDASYIPELRKTGNAPVFGLTSNHVAIGRIQGRQFAALLPHGGTILYIQGPAENSAAKERSQGMLETKPSNIQVIVLKAQWTEESSTRAVRSWLKLATARRAAIDLIGAQDDSMALGARKAFEGLTNELEKERWLNLPYTGCDGLPKTGQAWVRNGLLSATVFVPPNAGQALEMLFHALSSSKGQVPERVLTVPVSIPALSELKPSIPRD